MNRVKEILNIDDLEVKYTSGGKTIHAVNGVSLALKPGVTLGLVGETGAGKTTIAKSILRILPEFSAKITRGKIELEGKNLLQLTTAEMSKIRGSRISMIFQDPMTALNPTIKVGEQIMEVILLHNDVDPGEARKRSIKMLELVGIPGKRFDEYPFQFSGGMKQRVVIAMALACNPKILLADEPTTALDVTIQAQILEMMEKLRNEYNMAMIMITHDLGVVAGICDEVGVIYAGQIVEYGTKKDIFLNPRHPYTIGLFDALPKIKKDSDQRLMPIPGLPPNPTNLPSGCFFHPRCRHATDECKTGDLTLAELEPGHFSRCIKFDSLGR